MFGTENGNFGSFGTWIAALIFVEEEQERDEEISRVEVCKDVIEIYRQHPLRTKAITAGVLSAVSDIVSQKLTGIQKLQLRRLLLKAGSVLSRQLLGAAYLGPFGHFLHIILDKIFKGNKDPKTVAKKVVVEQLTASPWNNLVFMLYYGLAIEREVGHPGRIVKAKIKKDYPSLQVTVMDVLACCWVDKSPIRTPAVSRHFPHVCWIWLGNISEPTSKNYGIEPKEAEVNWLKWIRMLLAALGSAFMSNTKGYVWVVMLGVIGGALATVVNTLQHGGQVGMVFDMYMGNAGFLKLMEETIESNVSKRYTERRENREILEMKVALQLGRSLSELKHIAALSSENRESKIKEFASKLF
ncbi:peroxisomal membrane protein PMP22-like [Quillaja saponaria]|uniref:Peroxisomal membrane protein PMP22-like n=1 Tax=Quillaja saponaria TaxID=32244 RepID=A0AAD7KVE4_QUISA|nr:peroxisomal membrane protein PMP22-like [Quillaja saponaria]